MRRIEKIIKAEEYRVNYFYVYIIKEHEAGLKEWFFSIYLDKRKWKNCNSEFAMFIFYLEDKTDDLAMNINKVVYGIP